MIFVKSKWHLDIVDSSGIPTHQNGRNFLNICIVVIFGTNDVFDIRLQLLFLVSLMNEHKIPNALVFPKPIVG